MSYLGFLPVSLFVLSVGTFIITYIVAVVRDDVSAAFPYISDTGAVIPGSCIFGQFLNIAAFLSLTTIYIRYRAVATLCYEETDKKIRRINTISLFFGIISSFGCSLVANFQEESLVGVVHIIGAVAVFGFGIIYAILQTYVSYLMNPYYNGVYIFHIRLVVTIVSCIAITITFITMIISREAWKKASYHKSPLKWDPEDVGYSIHLVSTVGEWVTALTFLCFFLTYVKEFHKFDLMVHVQPLVCHLNDHPEDSSQVNQQFGILP